MPQEKVAILPTDRLLRRVLFLDPNFIKPDGTPASSCFSLKRGENGLSVEVERLTTYEKAIKDVSKYRLFSLHCSFVRSLNLECVHDPLPDNYAHALICGDIKRSVSRKLAQNSMLIDYPK